MYLDVFKCVLTEFKCVLCYDVLPCTSVFGVLTAQQRLDGHPVAAGVAVRLPLAAEAAGPRLVRTQAGHAQEHWGGGVKT